jgi:hypothetical protein
VLVLLVLLLLHARPSRGMDVWGDPAAAAVTTLLVATYRNWSVGV